MVHVKIIRENAQPSRVSYSNLDHNEHDICCREKIFTKVKRCDMCKKESALADTFIFKGKAYCMNCLYDLIMEMAEDGNVTLTFDNCEENGILVNF